MNQSSSTKKTTPIVEILNEKPDLRKKEPPLVSVQVTNPITYIKNWWKKVMSKEGVDFSFKIKPLTAIAITIVIATFSFGVGKFSFTAQKPFIKYVPVSSPTPTPTINPWRDTAFSGTLRYSTAESRFYLMTTSSEAINLDVLENVDLTSFIGRRIFATGKYNPDTHLLIVSDANDLELLPKKVESVPVSLSTPEPSPAISPKPFPTSARPSVLPEPSDSPTETMLPPN